MNKHDCTNQSDSVMNVAVAGQLRTGPLNAFSRISMDYNGYFITVQVHIHLLDAKSHSIKGSFGLDTYSLLNDFYRTFSIRVHLKKLFQTRVQISYGSVHMS